MYQHTEEFLQHTHEMKLHEVHLDKDRDDKFDFIDIKVISDCHIGDSLFLDELLQHDIEWLQEKPNRFGILNGDILNCATIRSVSDSYAETLTPHQELKYARKIFEPVKDKILASDEGNHEYRIYKETGIDVAEELASSLGIYYEKEAVMLKIKFGERKTNKKPQVYNLYMTHGFTGSRTIGGKTNRLDDLSGIILSDIFVIGHSHQQMAFPKLFFIPDNRNNKIIAKEIKKINCGHYLKYGGYGKKRAYHPTPPGTPVIRLYAEQKEKEVII